MKTTMKNLFSLILMVSVLFLASCSKTDDPTPVTPTVQTNLDKVKATLVGTWTFSSMTITGLNSANTSVTATVTDCKSYPSDTFFSKDKLNAWKPLTPQYIYEYKGGNAVDVTNLCPSKGDPLKNENVVATENSNGTVRLTFSFGVNYDVNVSDLTSTTIKGTVINDKGYVVIITYNRK
jgi:hypothetical protein